MKPFRIDCPDNVLLLLNRLEAAGYEAYAVGGCVRDALLGQTPHDWDITTSALPGEMKAVFQDFRTVETGIRHGTVTVILDAPYEITTFRVDGTYSDGRHPDSVAFSRRLADDLSRRDFTINAMAYSPSRGLTDFFGGVEDLRGGVIRCVGDANRRMLEDALRVMRAVRFQSRLGFAIAPETARAVEDHVTHLSHVSAERIGAEFFKTVTAPFAAKAIRENRALFAYLVPEWNARPASDFERMLGALEASDAPAVPLPAEWADDMVRLALFFRGLSDPDGDAQHSARLAAAVMGRLRFSNGTIRSVEELLAHHDIPLPITRAQTKRLMGKLSEAQLHRLLKLLACGAFNPVAPDGARLEEVSRLWDGVCALRAENAACTLRDLAVSGADLMAQGIPAGPRLGRIMAALLDEVIADALPNRREDLLRRAAALNAPQA